MTIKDNKENIRVLLYTMIAGQGVLLTHIASEASQKHGTTYRLTLEPKVCEFTEGVVVMKPENPENHYNRSLSGDCSRTPKHFAAGLRNGYSTAMKATARQTVRAATGHLGEYLCA